MLKNKYSGPTQLEALQHAKLDLEEQEENLIINKIIEEENNTIIEVIEKREINKYIKDIIYQLLKNMGFKINIEIHNTKEIPTYEIYSSNDSLLIGKNGKNLNSLRIIISEILKKEINIQYKFHIDIADYNQKRINNLITLAANISKEVEKSKIPAKLDSMNSYERMIVHNSLKDNKNIYTESIGEEPNRYIMIKPREE
ncbi:MAG: hypothetical protein J6B89_03985 [Bacilli bacterium]|nr:hypothetical protein [Bacilli bacterium]